MFKILSTLVFILLILLTPPAVLAYISQDAVPGDVTYPVKRKLEDGILLAASVNPTTKAWFAVTRSQRRFKESKVLTSRNERKTKPLKELLLETRQAAKDIHEVKNDSQRKQLVDKYNSLVTEYKKELTVQATVKSSPAPITPATGQSGQQLQPTPTPQPTTASRSTPTATPQPEEAALAVTCSANLTASKPGDKITWIAQASGGNGSYTYSWSGSDSLSGTSQSVEKTYSTTSEKTAAITVRSGSKTVTNKACSNKVTVRQPATTETALTVICSASRTSVKTGEQITWTAQASGGNGIFSYTWSGSDSLSGTSQTVEKNYTQIGEKTAAVTVKSGTQTVVSKPCSNKVLVTAPATTIASITVSCASNVTSAKTGDRVTWSAQATGGNGSYSYTWSGSDNLSGSAQSFEKIYQTVGEKTATVTVKSGTQTSPAKACTNKVIVRQPTIDELCPEPTGNFTDAQWKAYQQCISDNLQLLSYTPGAPPPDYSAFGTNPNPSGQDRGRALGAAPKGKGNNTPPTPPLINAGEIRIIDNDLSQLSVDNIKDILRTNATSIECKTLRYKVIVYSDAIKVSVDNAALQLVNSLDALDRINTNQVQPNIASNNTKKREIEDLFAASDIKIQNLSTSVQAFENNLTNFNCDGVNDSQKVTNLVTSVNNIITAINENKKALQDITSWIIKLAES